MSDKCIDTIEFPAASAPMRWGSWLKKGADMALADTKQLVLIIMIWHERNRQRFALKQLEDHRLEDIGYSREECERESLKPFWKP